jgi:hypothetical protein
LVSGDLIAILVGAMAGLVASLCFVWPHRKAIKRSWQEALGIQTAPPASHRPGSSPRTDRGAGFSRSRQLAIGVGILATFGSAFVASQSADQSVRLVNVALCAVLGVGTVLLLVDARRR